jgi:hypothetical protein
MPESILQKIKTYAQKVKNEEKRIKSSLLKFRACLKAENLGNDCKYKLNYVTEHP